MNWRVVLEKDVDTGDWAIWCPELPGCVSAGRDEAEALENIREAISLYLEPEALDLSREATVRQVSVP
ncbi:MAG: type II toxin-antitoxin system HicB family antitoxin [Armatimonadetes bacterium]|jgi:predicted RNase H-like HicB family nuclease|nr:type II toxin-antitoxin system HicB family antitoxin [Armatimonadota bacterium]HOC32002.1 type II toxin-antitoxin system HicB family antitoxin [Armatimonadota bacterium]